MSHVARVGAILTVGVLLFGGIFYLLSGRFTKMKSYPITVIFDNALGLQPGAKVRMSGVDVGSVARIDLDPNNKARMRLYINKEVGIPVDSTFTITGGSLIGEKYIDILPSGASKTMDPNAVVQGPKRVKEPMQIDEVAAQATKLMADVQKITGHLNKILGDPTMQAGIRQSVANLAMTTARAQELISAAQLTVMRNQSQIDKTMANLADASTELRGAMADVHGMTAQPGIREDVKGAADAIRSATERADALLQDVREVTGDQRVAHDLKDTVHNMSEATGYARDVAERIDRVFGGAGGGAPHVVIKVPGPKLGTGARVALDVAGSGSGNVRSDLTLTIPTGKDAALRLGLYDFTENNRIIAQRMQWVDPKTAMRYGIFAGRLGVGMDYDAGRKLNFSADLYNPKFPRLDLRGRYYLSNDFGAVFGVDGILRQPRAVVGIQWRH